MLFAADHDITLQGVSASGSEVTEIQVRNFLQGGGAINAFCRSAGASLTVVDVGVKGELEGAEGLVRRKVVHAARDFSLGPAMSPGEALACLQVGIDEGFIDSANNNGWVTSSPAVATKELFDEFQDQLAAQEEQPSNRLFTSALLHYEIGRASCRERV